MTPLISVTTPCYNAAHTLPFALASLLTQSYSNWECIVVDDGSSDDPRRVIEQIADPRIRYLRLPENMGRGVARQVALDQAAGAYLCKLDADDWIYPSKLACQLSALQSRPQVALVSTGIAIVDQGNQILSVRSRGAAGAEPMVRGPLRRPGPPPVAHAASMLRMEVARQYRYDPSFYRSEDADYLIRVLLDHPHCVLSGISYAYAEYRAITREEILASYRFRVRTFWKYRRLYPAASGLHIALSLAKSLIYRIAFATGLDAHLIGRRSQPPTAGDIVEFLQARATVAEMHQRIFGGTAPDRIEALQR